jgi:Zn-dependent alcohol dehydrogenase
LRLTHKLPLDRINEAFDPVHEGISIGMAIELQAARLSWRRR